MSYQFWNKCVFIFSKNVESIYFQLLLLNAATAASLHRLAWKHLRSDFLLPALKKHCTPSG